MDLKEQKIENMRLYIKREITQRIQSLTDELRDAKSPPEAFITLDKLQKLSYDLETSLNDLRGFYAL